MTGQSDDPRTTFGSRDSSVSRTEEDTLASPGRSFTNDFGAFDASGEPVSVKTTERVHHVHASYSPADPGETIEAVEYVDGMGRTVQTRVQAEDLDFGEAGLTRSSVGDAVGSSPSSGPWVRLKQSVRLDVFTANEPIISFLGGFIFECIQTRPIRPSPWSGHGAPSGVHHRERLRPPLWKA